MTRAGSALVVKPVTHEKHPEGVAVYNFEVEDDHTYFVGTANGGAWVHNDCWSIARSFRKTCGGQVWKLTSKNGVYVDRAHLPFSGPKDEFGDFVPWFHHVVHVKDEMVRDPIMLGHENAVPLEEWQTHWNHFSEHNFVPFR